MYLQFKNKKELLKFLKTSKVQLRLKHIFADHYVTYTKIKNHQSGKIKYNIFVLYKPNSGMGLLTPFRYILKQYSWKDLHFYDANKKVETFFDWQIK